MEKFGYRFSFGPWNIHEGADPFGPPVRTSLTFSEKLKYYKDLGYDAVQFHDDDAVPNLDSLSADGIRRAAREMKKVLDDHGLIAEFVAPRLWEHPQTIDGAFTSNNPLDRDYAIERSKKAVDIGQELDCNLMVIWYAREGSYIRESKDPVKATHQLLGAINTLLEYNQDLRIAIEPKPNEPMDLAYIPTIGHALALGFKTNEPERVGSLVESAHAILAGLDPSDEMAFALSFDKLFSVHLNDQNGLKFDQDRTFGMVDLRRAFNQVRVLDKNKFYDIGIIGMDVKVMRTQPAEIATKHLKNSIAVFLRLVEIVRSLDQSRIDDLISNRDYEELDWLIFESIIGG
jgi:xylose isomerase